MIIVAGTVSLKPGRREAAMRAAASMVEATRAEAGCISYAFYGDLVDPNTFFIFEEWESEEALARHFETAHMAAFQQQLPDLVAGGMAIKRYQVASAGGM